ncbi:MULTISPECIES: class II fructose-bisphosphate aldolase [Paenibacillus]|uniref:class II fructose-bisphosphate aldolase n=1 Tax=Paenibacillus TaxID=44249 RepID=UPI0007809BC2|nr:MULTISPECIES: class II fructose-bisphosphate aldolase [Paenibacillus]MCL6662009.1 class II fructose-bisphosphate aldolase [Paenibacillus amylolyticus]MEC0125512.1 class II fructose-bisphosphate aldolase [Paenibacillus pabuli]
MPLVTLNELMKDAEAKNYAVGAYNVNNLELIRGIIAAAEDSQSPVILSFAEVHIPLVPLEVIAPIMLEAARKAKVPVAVHLDHGQDHEILIRAMKLGFSSIMFDGAHLQLEENIRQTNEISKIAKALGVSVEAELGKILRPEGGGDEEEEEEYDPDDIYTNPKEAKTFIENTNIDALAVAYGTAHGVYTKEPVLDFDRLQLIKDITGMPLVMHGGSGLDEAAYVKSIQCGIRKLNYYSNMAFEVANTIQSKLNENRAQNKKSYYHDLSKWAMEAIQEDIVRTMRIFGSAGKA